MTKVSNGLVTSVKRGDCSVLANSWEVKDQENSMFLFKNNLLWNDDKNL